MITPSLQARRIAIPRSGSQTDELVNALALAGAAPIVIPAMAGSALAEEALHVALQQLQRLDWLAFLSGSAVQAVFERAQIHGLTIGDFRARRLAALSPMAAQTLTRIGAQVDFQGDLANLPTPQAGERWLLAGASENETGIGGVFAARDADLLLVPATPDRISLGLATRTSLGQGVNAVALLSPQAARDWFDLQDLLGNMRPFTAPTVSIGQTTAQAAQAYGFSGSVAERPTLSSLLDALKGV
jgi:uroporphyrinogen-III synthase